MCSSLNPQKSIRIDAELCDGVQAYALANRLALKPRWFSNFINSAVREKLVREGFLPADAPCSLSDGSPSALRDSGNFAVREKLISEGVLAGNLINDTFDGSRRVLGGSAAQGGDSVPSDNCVDEGVILGNPINDTSASSHDVLGASVAQGGGILVEDKKVLERIAQSEEPYLAYLVEKNSRADNQDSYPRGFDYPQNPAAAVLNGEKPDDKAGVPVGCKKPAIVDSLDNCPKSVEVISESQNREVR
ncbi:MAG: hypothetical protein SPF41_09280 [Candidatus Merdousia sp.]|nr:hypothetical protein [Candidatus Merdousia sp.]